MKLKINKLLHRESNKFMKIVKSDFNSQIKDLIASKIKIKKICDLDNSEDLNSNLEK